MPYTEHPVFAPPNDDQTLWRYMDLPKYVSLLRRHDLWFSTLKNLDDPFEGSYPDSQRDRVERLTGTPCFRVEEGERVPTISPYAIHESVEASCWFASDYESVALWAQYAQAPGSVAIRTTFGGLRSCFQDTKPDILIGKVHYIDYAKDNFVTTQPANILNACFHKRRSFEHENEVRAALWSPHAEAVGCETCEAGTYVPIAVGELIQAVHVSPAAPGWVEDAVRSLTEAFKLDGSLVHRSGMDTQPLRIQ